MRKTERATPLEALKRILSEKGAGTQEDLRMEMEKEGLEVNQSTISRCLRKLGAIKTFDGATGDAYYTLPAEATPPPVVASISDLVAGIKHNNSLVVITTSPGSASLIARQLDHFDPGYILGTVAGDDTVFVAPANEKQIRKLAEKLQTLFGKTPQ